MLSQDLSGRTILVTGAGQRLGRVTALALSAAGAGIVAHYNRSRVEAESLADEIRGAGRPVWLFQADLSDSMVAEGMVGRVVAEAGPLHGVVNSASIFPEDTLLTMSESSVLENFRINAWAPFVLGRAVAAQGIAASIVNFLDTRMNTYDAKHASYHLSKRMLLTLTRMMALEFAPRVRVNAVAPGLVLPPHGKDQAYLESLRDTNPLKSVGTPEEVARTVLFLMSGAFITGQVIHVDGGRHMLGGAYA